MPYVKPSTPSIWVFVSKHIFFKATPMRWYAPSLLLDGQSVWELFVNKLNEYRDAQTPLAFPSSDYLGYIQIISGRSVRDL